MNLDETAPSLQILMNAIEGFWSFDGSKYPALSSDSSADAVQLFARGHILSHLVKVAGNIATLVEQADHGCSLPVDNLGSRVLCARFLVDALRLACLEGVTAEDLVKYIKCRVEE